MYKHISSRQCTTRRVYRCSGLPAARNSSLPKTLRPPQAENLTKGTGAESPEVDEVEVDEFALFDDTVSLITERMSPKTLPRERKEEKKERK